MSQLTVAIVAIDLEDDLTEESLALALLGVTPSERQRAARFVRLQDRLAFARCRGALRRLLGERLGRDPLGIEFEVSARGKLSVPGGPAFNVSHTRGRGVVAVGAGAALGVDVEERRPDVELLDIAASHFAPHERAALQAVDGAEREARFFRIWSRKEAVLKCTGVGIADDLLAIDVWGEDGSPRVHRADDPSWLRLQLIDLDFGPGHAAALVVDGEGEVVLELSAPRRP